MVISFGYDVGPAPRSAQKVFDVQTLTHDTGRDDFLAKYQEIVEYGRKHPTESIAIGCERGRHRSVVLANKVATALRTSVYHRDRG